MLRRTLVAGALCVALSPGAAKAQELAGPGDMAAFIPTFFGPHGLDLQTGIPHFAHFESQALTNIGAFNTAFASQLTALPVPSPASGFTYTYDPKAGIFKRSTQSFGPILADRSETIGKNRVSFGFSYQHFEFDSLGGVTLNQLPIVFQHASFTINGVFPAFEQDVVSTMSSISAKLEQVTPALTYGITDRLDVAVAVPIVRVDLAMSSTATIVRFGTGPNDTNTHFFGDHASSQSYNLQDKTAAGVGDVLVRLKGSILHQDANGLAVGVEGRLPTGAARNLLGSGALGIEPFLVYSYANKSVAPHVKVAYQWNGKSILGGTSTAQIDPTTHRVTGLIYNEASLPKQLLYAVGADLGVTDRVTLAFDLLGRRVQNGPRLQSATFVRQSDLLPNQGPLPDVQVVPNANFFVNEVAAGLKFNPTGKFLVDLNVLVSLDHNGLHHKVAPLVGIEYGF
jgi:hypothetical protein